MQQQKSFFEFELIPFDDESSLSRLDGWTVLTVEQRVIKIKLRFADPLEVSQNEERDKLVIQIHLPGVKDVN